MTGEENMFDETKLDVQDTDRVDVPDFQETLECDFPENGSDAEIDAAVLIAENAELRDQNLRLAADMENLRRRTSRDVADARNYSVAGFARDMLSVLDNLARALDAIAPDVRESDTHLNALAEGVEMTQRAMIVALERYGVKKIEAEGARFDPNFHQAMFEIPDAEKPAGTIAKVMQEGYMIAERVLRPAMVGITSGNNVKVSVES